MLDQDFDERIAANEVYDELQFLLEEYPATPVFGNVALSPLAFKKIPDPGLTLDTTTELEISSGDLEIPLVKTKPRSRARRD